MNITPNISIIAVTNRKGAIKFYEEQLKKQTFKDFEFICANDSGEKGGFIPRQKNEGDVWNLNKAYNDCLNKAKGELLVFLQDFIWIPANGLQRFWDNYQTLGDVLISAPGHKYKEDLKTIDEVDTRCNGEMGLEECNWTFWELNWASCPRNIMVDFDESMDKVYGGENAYISHRVGEIPVYLDRMNECKGLSQEICGGRPKDWNEKHFNKTKLLRQWITT